MRQFKTSEQREEAIKKAFVMLDKDASGYIEWNEIKYEPYSHLKDNADVLYNTYHPHIYRKCQRQQLSLLVLGGLACETRYFIILVVIITLLGVILVEVGK